MLTCVWYDVVSSPVLDRRREGEEGRTRTAVQVHCSDRLVFCNGLGRACCLMSARGEHAQWLNPSITTPRRRRCAAVAPSVRGLSGTKPWCCYGQRLQSTSRSLAIRLLPYRATRTAVESTSGMEDKMDDGAISSDFAVSQDQDNSSPLVRGYGFPSPSPHIPSRAVKKSGQLLPARVMRGSH